MTRIEQLANALAAVGCPNPRSTAVLTMEVLPLLDQPAAEVVSLGKRLTQERGERFGHPRDNWRRIGIKWQATLDLAEPIPPHIVGLMMLDLKVSRLVETPNDQDSLDDIEGYVAAQRMLFD